MYENELQLFKRSNDVIWTDEYISKSLLDAHLDESNDAASRKSEKRTEIINLINSNVKPNSKIIDLGCGPGLYEYELGKFGHKILGVDINKESINYAIKNKCSNNLTEYRYCNYLQDTINDKFDAAMMIYCDFGALIPGEQKLLLNKIFNLLNDDGLFIFDIFGKNEINNIKDNREWFISGGGDFWSKDPYICIQEKKFFANEAALGTRYFLINQLNGTIKEFIIWDQYYDDNSIRNLLSENGFEITEIRKNLIKSNEEVFFVIAKKK